MTDLSRQILADYQVRKTRTQKSAFIQFLQSRIPELRVLEGGFPKCRNLVIGDPEKAKVLLSAHYDTCARLPFPNFITPKNPILAIAYSILIILPIIPVIAVLNVISRLAFEDPLLSYWISLAVYGLFMWLLLAGPANRHTANDNTSGIITLLEIYDRLSNDQKQEVAFLFFDNEEKGVLGSAQFRRTHKKMIKKKLLINFDCVSDGDNFLFGVSKKANAAYHVPIAQEFPSEGGKQILLEKLERIYYPSDQAGFPYAIAVAALKHKRFLGYYLDRIHTKRDTVFDESNIAYLAAHTVSFIGRI